MGSTGETHLLELLDINVELSPKLGFGLRKSRHLPRQLMRLGRLGFLLFALLLQPCHLVLDLELFGTKERVELQLAQFVLIDERFELQSKAGNDQ
jgi:hypothetical protein